MVEPLPKLSRRKLTRIYRRYAKAMGWNTHIATVRLHVDLWLSDGVGAVGRAIEYDAHARAIRKRRRQPLVALVVFGVAVTAILSACVIR